MSEQSFSRSASTAHRTRRIALWATRPFLLLLLLSFLSPGAYAADNKPFDTKGPIVITSSTMTADNKAHTALFEGSVVAKSETATIYSDRMLVYSSEDGKSITRIDCSGHVKLVKGERVITSEAATYFADEDKAIFTGDPRATEGGNIVTGTRMTYLMKEDRSVVENSKVFLENKNRKEK